MLQALDFRSTESQVTLGLTITTFSLLYYVYRRANAVKYPDGPMPFPVLGNIPQIIAAGDIVNFLEKYRKIYGNVFTMEIGGVKRVVVSGVDNIHYLLAKNADYTSTRSAKAMPPSFSEYAQKTPGINWASHSDWRTFRSFVVHVLKDQGMGKNSMEPKILTEVEQYISHYINPNLGVPIDMKMSLTYATSNIISQMVIGRRSDYEDPKLHRLNAAISDAFRSMLKASITKNIPLISYLPGDLSGLKRDMRANRSANEALYEIIGQVRENLDTENQNNFTSQALLHGQAQDEAGKKNHMFTDANIAIAVRQLYAAGTDTTATALRWALLYMILYPDVQERVRKEIHEVLGERQPSTRERLLLPFTDAVVHEALRFGDVAPTGLPRTLDKDLTVDGKTIPAGAQLLFNNTSIMNNLDFFPEPEKFKPERFLGADGQALKSKVLSFGIGRRACLGESLARMEFFLFFVTFLQKFKVSNPQNQKLTLTPVITITRAPKDYKIVFERC